jgi:hypothetical protein
VSVTACSARAAEDSKSTASPVELCSGTVHCTIEQSGVDATFTRNGDTCYLGEVEMTPDGRTVSPEGTWAGTAQHFTLCTSDQVCLACDAIDQTAPPSAQSGHCTGSPDDCTSNSPGSCADIVGCRMASHLRADGSWNNVCEGTPADCEDMTDEKFCKRQGCVWK